MARRLPANASLEYLRKEAKDILKKHAAGDVSVCDTLRHIWNHRNDPDQAILRAKFTLQNVQHALALQHGFTSWKEMKEGVMAKTGETDSGSGPFKTLPDLAGLRDAGIAVILRDVDMNVLVRALYGETEEVLDLFFRNMSKRAADIIRESLAQEGPFGPVGEEAERELLEIANRLYAKREIYLKKELAPMASQDESTEGKGKITRGDLDRALTDLPAGRRTSAQLIDFLKKTLAVARGGGLVVLDGLSERIDDEFLRTGLRLVVDGTDTDVVRGILEARKKTLLGDYERRLDMTITALESISRADHPVILEEKCRAFLPSGGGGVPPAG